MQAKPSNDRCDRADWPECTARQPHADANLRLAFPAPEHEQEAMAYRQEHIDCGEPTIHGSGGLMRTDTYQLWLERVLAARTIAPPDWVPFSTYFAFVGDRIVGTIQVRHQLNEHILRVSGHIGYAVRPSERRKGYATRMLALGLDRCRELGIEKALVTCDHDNLASANTIRKGGGVFENQFVEENGNVIDRYWIVL